MIKAGSATSLASHTIVEPQPPSLLKPHVAAKCVSEQTDDHVVLEVEDSECYAVDFPQFYGSIFVAENHMSFGSLLILHGASDMHLLGKIL